MSSWLVVLWLLPLDQASIAAQKQKTMPSNSPSTQEQNHIRTSQQKN